jgi:hypothetical protein
MAKLGGNSIYRGLGGEGNAYEIALIATWRAALAASKHRDEIPFSKEDLVKHGDELRRLGITPRGAAVKNVPDIIYTYRARSDLPAEILAHGDYAIVGRGKGRYAFYKIQRPNRVSPPAQRMTVPVPDVIPKWARSFMTDDEQGMLTAIASNGLVARHLRLKRAFRLQSHLRCSVADYGQVEIDELYVGEDDAAKHVVVAVEAKDRSAHDLLNIAQLYGCAQALLERYPDHQLKLLGVKPVGDSAVVMCEFRVGRSPRDIREAGEWIEYQLK